MMIKNFLTAAGFLGLALASPLSVHSAEPKMTAPRPAAPTAPAPAPPVTTPSASKPRPLPYQGVVSRVSPTEKTFTITTKAGKDHVFTITEKTQFLKDDAPAKFEDIKRDDVVRGSRLKLGENQWEALKVIIGAKEKAS